MCFRPSAVDASTLNICPACGFNNPLGETTCQKCGAEISERSQAADAIAAAPGIPSIDAPAPGVPAPGVPAPGVPSAD